MNDSPDISLNGNGYENSVPDRKRSKRHRRQRNKISRRDQVESMKAFASWAQGVNTAYRRKFKIAIETIAPPIVKGYQR